MSTKVSVTSDKDFQLALLFGARVKYADGETKEFYPAIQFEAIQLPSAVVFPSYFRLKDEPALPTLAEAKARALEVLKDVICQAITDYVLEEFDQDD